MKFVLKKKIVLKTKTNLHFVNQKTLKGKKKRKEKKWTKVLKQLKKKSHWEIWDSKLEKRHCHIGTAIRHRSYEQVGRQNVDVKV